MTATRRKSYIDLAAVKRSRKNYVGGITRAKETLQTMLDLDPSELNTRKIEGALTSITRAETGFYSNLDEAQAFIAEDEAQEEKQAEEDEATELFEASVQEARELGDALLLLTNLRKNLDDFKIDLDHTCQLLVWRDRDRKYKPLITQSHTYNPGPYGRYDKMIKMV